jgi:hypothetical protein
MIQMHRFAVDEIEKTLRHRCRGYVWNDSALLFSYTTGQSLQKLGILTELSKFKYALDTKFKETPSFAVCVMGLAFPSPSRRGPFMGRVVVLKTSSWAMANCFHIEEKLKRCRADWYIDSRITKDIDLPGKFREEKLKLLPKNAPRTIEMYKGYFHERCPASSARHGSA